ncbi:LRR receptor-like serine/threonine-protein kinase GSO1 [Ananas comosus]|uniref:LRR receptor-like serine/threonine-protein kinase GSO1 n=1 Tax=Ananas comosus TaxID=4615 RepID=A0A199ULJ2_ANACO|nr:LRR receptor-like serine/threonine-protein kinase GSO1 [Ananas comosus]
MERYANLFISFSLLFFFLNDSLFADESMASPLQLNHDQLNIMVNLSKSLSPNSYNNWNTSDPNPCLWESVTCSAGPSTIVTGLSLSNLGIYTAANVSDFFSILCRIDTLQNLNFSQNYVATIPDSFFSNCTGLSGLKSLDLSSNELTGPVRNFSSFASLETLDLSHNYLGGTVETQLSSLSKLKSLNLSSNFLMGTIPKLVIDGRKVAAFEELVLSENQFNGTIPREIVEYENLTMLDLSVNSLSGTIPEKIGMLSNLKTLDLSSNQLTGRLPATLSNISTLFRFAADGNNLTGNIPSISKFVSFLDLSYNNLGGEIPFDLLASPNLESVDLSHNRLGGAIPTNLSIGLQWLLLSENLLSGIIPTSIGKLSQLANLELDNNNLYSEIPSQLGNCSNLEFLDLSSNALYGELPKEIGNLQKLEVLALQTNNLSGEIPVEMNELQSLHRLNLSSNSFTGEILPTISNLRQLFYIHLQHNKFDGSIPDSINGLKFLYELYLSSNYFNGSIPSSLGGNVPHSLSTIPSLTELVLSYNNLSGVLPLFSSSVNVVTVGNKNLIILNRSAESNSLGNGVFDITDSSKRKIQVALVVVSSFVAGFSVSFLMSSLTWKFLIRKKATDVQDEDVLSDLNNRKRLQMVQRLRMFHERFISITSASVQLIDISTSVKRS